MGALPYLIPNTSFELQFNPIRGVIGIHRDIFAAPNASPVTYRTHIQVFDSQNNFLIAFETTLTFE